MRRLFLVRHGRADVPDEPRYWGRSDPPLCAAGRLQAGALAARLAQETIKAVFTSPLQRCARTAAAVAAEHGLTAECAPDLREIDFGDWEGLSFDEIRSRSPDESARWLAEPGSFTFPGGESVAGFRQRVLAAMRDVLSRAPGTIAVVTHGGPLRLIVCDLCGWPDKSFYSFSVDPGSFTIVDDYGDVCVLATLNDTCHLRNGCG